MARFRGDPNAPIGMLPVGLLSPSALRAPRVIPPYAEVTIEAPANDDGVTVDPKTGSITIINDDGTVSVDLNPQANLGEEKESEFGDNLAEIIDESELGRIADEVLTGISQDEMSRQGWLTDIAHGMRILGLKLKGPRTAIDTAALEGMSTVDHPMLLEAVLNFWANASGEFLPASGPVKIDDKLGMTGKSISLAKKLQDDFNYYLTTVATEYYPDTSKALLNVGFKGLVVKKVYNCPLRQRPVSEAIDATNLIVSDAAVDLRNSGRFTHEVTMRPSVLRRMQLAGAYRDVPISTPMGLVPNAVDQQVAALQGVQIISAQMDQDRDHTIDECYCELDIRGFEDRRNGKPTGLRLPYRVVIEKDSRQVLEIRRNWAEGDETKIAKVPFVVYVFVPGFGFYGIGLLNILGNTTNAMTAAWRETLDAGMFANFPGFLYSKLMSRQNTMEVRVPPGAGFGIDTQGLDDITKAVMPLPYKDVSTAFVQFQDKIAEQGRSLGGTAQIKVSEGRQDAPVGTTLAMIEQATKVERATHKELWRSQAQEFMLLKECFRENPGSFIKAIKVRGETDWDEESFIAALNDASLVPQADPNTPSHMHRLMKAMGLIQLDKAYPGVMDPVQIVERVVDMLGFGDFEALRNKAPAPGIPPELMVEMQRLQLEGQKLADKSTDREFKLRFEVLKGKIAMMGLQAEQQKREHELQLMESETKGEVLQHSTDLQQSNLELQGKVIEADADKHVANKRVEAEEVKGKHSVKAEDVAGKHAVKVAEHGAKEEEARAETEDIKGKHATATARATPRPRPAGKK